MEIVPLILVLWSCGSLRYTLHQVIRVVRSVAHPFSRAFLTSRQRSTQNRGTATRRVTEREGGSPRKHCARHLVTITQSLRWPSEMQYLRARDMNPNFMYAQITKDAPCRDDTAPQHVPSSAHYQQPQQKIWYRHEQHRSPLSAN